MTRRLRATGGGGSSAARAPAAWLSWGTDVRGYLPRRGRRGAPAAASSAPRPDGAREAPRSGGVAGTTPGWRGLRVARQAGFGRRLAEPASVGDAASGTRGQVRRPRGAARVFSARRRRRRPQVKGSSLRGCTSEGGTPPRFGGAWGEGVRRGPEGPSVRPRERPPPARVEGDTAGQANDPLLQSIIAGTTSVTTRPARPHEERNFRRDKPQGLLGSPPPDVNP